MILGLYETHLQVTNMDKSIEFYKTLGLELGYYTQNVSFFKIGEGKEHQILGLWKARAGGKVAIRHIAFKVELDFLLKAKEWLSDRNINTVGVFGRGNQEPIVHTWEPAAAIYFNDPDNNELEFCCRLDEPPRKLDYVPTWSEWIKKD